MKVRVVYPVTRYTEIEIPDKLAKAYKKAEDKEEIYEDILDYLQDTIPQIDAEADYKPDIYDWDEVE